MVSTFRKKAFLYFGGAFILLLGGAIVVTAPYHAISLPIEDLRDRSWEMWELSGLYSELHIRIETRGVNTTSAEVHLLFRNNDTLEETPIDFVMDDDNILAGSNPPVFSASTTIPLDFGNYTIEVVDLVNVGLLDLSLEQKNDRRNYVVLGGTLNIIGIVMGLLGWCVSGTLISSGDEAIVQWGYEEE
jgi:hypothetical protein